MTVTPRTPGPRYAALLDLLRTAEAVWNASRAFFARWDLGPSQFNVLNLLHLTPEGLSQTELSRQLIVHRSNVTGLVDRLEERGLVARHEVALDRRAYNVALTREGSALVESILPEYYAAAERLWKVVPEKRLGITTADLNAVADNALRIAAALEKSAAPDAAIDREKLGENTYLDWIRSSLFPTRGD